MHLMRHSTLEATETQPDNQSDTNELEDSRMIHNASTATVDTEDNPNITENSRRIREIPEFTAIQLARFWSRVEIGNVDQCWPWKGAKAASVYSPEIFYGNYRGFKVHRLAYHFLVGPIPAGLTIDHVKERGCTNTLCCNPDHLEPITQVEQVVRRDGEKSFTRMTVCKWGHPRPVGRKAHCKECAKRFAQECRDRKRDAL